MNTKGFSLTEMIVSMFIMTIIAGGVVMVMNTGEMSWQTNRTKITIQQELRRAVDWTRNELRHATPSSITDVPVDNHWYPQITFKKPIGVSGGAVTWSSDITLHQQGTEYRRTSAGTHRVIAQNLWVTYFRRLVGDPDRVEVYIGVRKKITKGEVIDDVVYFHVLLRNG